MKAMELVVEDPNALSHFKTGVSLSLAPSLSLCQFLYLPWSLSLP